MITPVYDERGQLLGFSKVTRDVTERKRLLDELRESLRVRDEFLSIASHELRTPLTSLSLQIQMLEKNIRLQCQEGEKRDKAASELIPRNLARTVAVCSQQAKKLERLLDELLDLTRIRTGKMTLEKRETDLSALVRQVVGREYHGTPEARFVSLHLASSVVGYWDSERIEQVVTNLLSNAFKYGEGKPIEVYSSIDEATGDGLLEVQDHGPGIPEEMKERIFERFERGVGPTKVSGLGLGLYIVRRIVQAHAGTVTVRSSPKRGSRFIVRLPLRHKEAVA